MQKKAKPWRILVIVIKWRHHANAYCMVRYAVERVHWRGRHLCKFIVTKKWITNIAAVISSENAPCDSKTLPTYPSPYSNLKLNSHFGLIVVLREGWVGWTYTIQGHCPWHYPSPNLMLTLSSLVGQNVGLTERYKVGRGSRKFSNTLTPYYLFFTRELYVAINHLLADSVPIYVFYMIIYDCVVYMPLRCKMVGISNFTSWSLWREGKYVFSVSKGNEKGQRTHFVAAKMSRKLSGLVIYSYLRGSTFAEV